MSQLKEILPFSRICNLGGEIISICNAGKQRYAAAVVLRQAQQPYDSPKR